MAGPPPAPDGSSPRQALAEDGDAGSRSSAAGLHKVMYTNCLFCHAALGSNDLIEYFPVGRRLAFDSARGRLWVVCARCRQWNLTPIEARWEAIEECERLFRDTRTRVSTDQIGLARVASRLDLVRIGRPERPEFAAWRYGAQLGIRRRRMLLQAGLGVSAAGAMVLGGATLGISLGTFGYAIYSLVDAAVNGSPEKVVARLDDPAGKPKVTARLGDSAGKPLEVRRKHLRHLVLREEDGKLRVDIRGRRKRVITLEGADAIHTTGRLLPVLNRFGGTRDQVGDAVRLLGEEIDPARAFARVARLRSLKYPTVKRLPEAARLALEMAAHEESERRALEGELAFLEMQWREAEEIAGISDDLLLPERVWKKLRSLGG